jgi:hypothetical protein
MTRRRNRRRRLLWAGVLLGLVVIVAVLSVVDAGLRIYDRLVSATRSPVRPFRPRAFRRAQAGHMVVSHLGV